MTYHRKLIDNYILFLLIENSLTTITVLRLLTLSVFLEVGNLAVIDIWLRYEEEPKGV